MSSKIRSNEKKPLVSLSMEQARRLYVLAGGPSEHTPQEWDEIHGEMEGVVNATTDRRGGRVILFWDCWDKKLSATKFAKIVRDEARRMGIRVGGEEILFPVSVERQTDKTTYPSLEKEISAVLNKYSLENPSNTPDFILAAFLIRCLDAFNYATVRRAAWYSPECRKEDGGKP